MATRVRGSSGNYSRSANGFYENERETGSVSGSYERTSRRYSRAYAPARGRTETINKRRKKNYEEDFLPSKKGILETLKEALFEKAKGEIDYGFLTALIAILAMGLVVLLSASAPDGKELHNNSYYFFIRQLAFSVMGLAAMYVISKMDYKSYRKYTVAMAALGIFLLIMVLAVGSGYNGAKRWLLGIQPSELMKPITAMAMADLITSKKYSMKHLREFIIPVIYLAIVAALMIAEPHVSGAIIIAGIALCVMIAAGMPVIPTVIIGVLGGGAVVFGVWLFSPIRWNRILSFLDPFRDQQGASYQIVQSIYSIGSGGIGGRGLGQSLQKFRFLPEPYNDFIFSVVCEELGLIGAIIVMGLFAVLIIRGIKIAMNAPDRYSMLLATGIVAQVAIQSVLNMGVASGAVPNTGISLPFFSYGGTSIFTLLCEMGILLNISRQSKK